jgi:hypothetical protein
VLLFGIAFNNLLHIQRSGWYSYSCETLVVKAWSFPGFSTVCAIKTS